MQSEKEIYKERIDAILEWADSADAPGDFDTTFVHNMSERLETFGKLTEAQREGIDNIIEKFGIDTDA